MQLLVVNFHYFREKKPKKGIFPLTLRDFEYQIEIISKYYDFVSEDEIIENLKKGRKISKNSCLLTFDDGLKDQMKVANLLIKKGIPGMFYVSSDDKHLRQCFQDLLTQLVHSYWHHPCKPDLRYRE